MGVGCAGALRASEKVAALLSAACRLSTISSIWAADPSKIFWPVPPPSGDGPSLFCEVWGVGVRVGEEISRTFRVRGGVELKFSLENGFPWEGTVKKFCLVPSPCSDGPVFFGSNV